MTRVIAALDNSLAAQPALATALALGRLLDAEVDAVHVRTDGDRVARGVAESAGVRLREANGPIAERLVEEASADEIVCVVLGTRGTPGGALPAGSTALAVLSALPKPVAVVPPNVRRPGRLECVLVPLEGSVSSSLAPRGILQLAGRAEINVVVLHVHDEASLPAFTDQPQHEAQAWAREFLARYVPAGIGDVRLELRVGRTEEIVPQAADDVGADLIALGWARQLAPGRAPVVTAALERARVPVLLVPVVVRNASTRASTSVAGGAA